MKKTIIFEEEEFNNKLIEFSENLLEYSKQSYGFNLIDNETKSPINTKESIIGNLFIPWNKTFSN